MIDSKRVLAAMSKSAQSAAPISLSKMQGDAVRDAAQRPSVSHGHLNDPTDAVVSAGAADAADAADVAGAANAANVANAADAANSADSADSAGLDASKDGRSLMPRPEHPNPQFARDAFLCLNGWWSCAFAKCSYDPKESARSVCAQAARPACIDTPILVPFSPEATLSGVGRQLRPDEALWYRTEVSLPEWAMRADGRCLLHFEAVDDTCAVWCNSMLLGTHEGGYLPFSFDMSPALIAFPENRSAVIELCVVDPTDAGVQLRGKQRLSSGDFWHMAQSGIWQPVWIEGVPRSYLRDVRFDTDIMEDELTVHVRSYGEGRVRAELWEGDVLAAQGDARTQCEHAELTALVPRPHLWHPNDPFLYRVVLRFEGDDGSRDVVQSYCAWRTAEVQPDGSGGSSFYLNGELFFLKGVLYEGYWPESLMTAPNDDVFASTIQQAKAGDFNMLRCHVKIEAARFYYHCDRLGMLVWQDMVSGGGACVAARSVPLPGFRAYMCRHFTDTDCRHTRKLGGDHRHYRDVWWRTCRQMLDYLGSHPSVVTWVLFNEGWGQFDSRGFARLVREIDPTRPVEAVSGWFDQGAGDFCSVRSRIRGQKAIRDWRQRSWRIGRACITDRADDLAPRELDALESQGLSGYVCS